MVPKQSVEGYNALIETAKYLQSEGKTVFILFSGSIDEQTGESWCPDCTTYGPIVDKVMDQISDENVAYVYCTVGNRDYWKDQNNEFRADQSLKLTGIPTLMKWGNAAIKLVEDQLEAEAIKDMIEED